MSVNKLANYKGWQIRCSAELGFFSSGRGGKVKRSYSGYKDMKSWFGPEVSDSSITGLKKQIDKWESDNKKSFFSKLRLD